MGPPVKSWMHCPPPTQPTPHPTRTQHPTQPIHATPRTPSAAPRTRKARTQSHAHRRTRAAQAQAHGVSMASHVTDASRMEGGGGTGQGQGCCPPAVLLASSTKRAAVRSTDTALQLLSALLTVPDQGPGPGLEGSAISSLAWISSLDPSRWAGRAGHGRRLQPPPPSP